MITEPERKSLRQLARASPASRASHCYPAIGLCGRVILPNEAITPDTTVKHIANAIRLKTNTSVGVIEIG